MELDDVVALEQKEFDNIVSELDALDVLNEGTLPLDGEDYLIYKLQKECHVTNSFPANEFTKKFYEQELKKIEDALD